MKKLYMEKDCRPHFIVDEWDSESSVTWRGKSQDPTLLGANRINSPRYNFTIYIYRHICHILYGDIGLKGPTKSKS